MHIRRVTVVVVACAAAVVGGYLWKRDRDQFFCDMFPDSIDYRAEYADQLERTNRLVSVSDIKRLRQEFPYQSLASRLEFEVGKPLPETPALSSATRAGLDEQDVPEAESAQAIAQVFADMRAKSIRLLHEEAVGRFASRAGFGFTRMPAVGPDSLPFSARDPVPLDSAPTASEQHSAEISVSYPESADDKLVEKWKLPGHSRLSELVSESRDDFLSPITFGHVKNREAVAGFIPHEIHSPIQPPVNDAAPALPDDNLDEDNPTSRWKIIQLELVSLLKHDTPAVYLSEHLPRMEDLSDERTRPLNNFESAALKQLQAGEEISAQTTGNIIEMVGAIRASKQCLDCHQVPRGTLLGAFTYCLQRDPPIDISPVASN